MSAAEAVSMCSPATLTHGWVIICYVSISFVLVRLSIDLVQTASQKTRKHFRESHHATTEEKAKPSKEKEANGKTGKNSYGSIQEDDKDSDEEAKKVTIDEKVQETTSLLSSSSATEAGTAQLLPGLNVSVNNYSTILSLRFQGLLLVALLVVSMLKNGGESCVMSRGLVWSCITVVALGAILTYRDAERERFGYLSRILYLATALTLAIPMTSYYFKNRSETFSGDELIVNIMDLYMLLALGESFFVPLYRSGSDTDEDEKGRLSTSAIATLLKPYVWPDKTADSALMNRIRACMTWVCVILSKLCNLSAPILVSAGFSFLSCASVVRILFRLQKVT